MAFFITSINIIVHLKFYGCTVYQCLAGDYESYDDFIIEYCKNCGGASFSSENNDESMIECEYCGAGLNDGEFCPECGKATDIKICPKCRIYAMYDAVTSAKAINRGEILEDRLF